MLSQNGKHSTVMYVCLQININMRPIKYGFITPPLPKGVRIYACSNDPLPYGSGVCVVLYIVIQIHTYIHM